MPQQLHGAGLCTRRRVAGAHSRGGGWRRAVLQSSRWTAYNLQTQRKAVRKLPLQARVSRLPVVCFPGLLQCPTMRRLVLEIPTAAPQPCVQRALRWLSKHFSLARSSPQTAPPGRLPVPAHSQIYNASFRIERAWRRSVDQPAALPPAAAAAGCCCQASFAGSCGGGEAGSHPCSPGKGNMHRIRADFRSPNGLRQWLDSAAGK